MNNVWYRNRLKLQEFFLETPENILNCFDSGFRWEILDVIDLREEIIIRTDKSYYVSTDNKTKILTMSFSTYKWALARFLSKDNYNAIIILSNN